MDIYWFVLSSLFFLGALNFIFVPLKKTSSQNWIKYRLLSNISLILGLVVLYIFISTK